MTWLARALLVAVTAMFGLIAHHAAATPLTTEEATRIDTIVSSAMQEVGTPSASVAVVRGGEVVFAKAYGSRQISPAALATTETRYRVASISKQFTAAAVLMLADDGKLSIDDRLNRYLPELGATDQRTIRQALTHTAGFPDFWTVGFVPPQLMSPTTPQDIVDRWGKAPAAFDPGSAWAYSNTGYVILGRLVEKVSGETLTAFLARRVFSPLQMTSASDTDGAALGDNDAHGYTRTAAGPVREAPLIAAGWTFGCGELSMIATDLARWDIALLGQRLLSPESFAELATDAKLKDGTASGYGFGVFVDTVGGHRRLRHNGDLPGYWAENRIYPDDNSAVVVMVNGSFGGSPHAVIADGIEQMLIPDTGRPASSPPPSAEQTLGTLIRQIREDRLDRSRLSPDLNAYLSGQTLTDYRESFERLGASLAVQPVSEGATGQTLTGSWVLVWADVQLLATVQVAQNGEVLEFSAYPVWLKLNSAKP